MTLPIANGEVLRGIRIEAQPMRVGRVPAQPVRVPDVVDSKHEALLRSIEADRHAARAEGEQAGYAEGLRRGLADAAAEAEAALQEAREEARQCLHSQSERMEALLSSLEGVRRDMLRLAEEDLVALCYETVCRIVGDAALEPAAVRDRVELVAAAWSDRPHAVLHVHPQDVQLLADTASRQGLRCVADTDVVLGGCVVRSTGDSLDARLETALAACRDSLLATRARRSAGETEA